MQNTLYESIYSAPCINNNEVKCAAASSSFNRIFIGCEDGSLRQFLFPLPTEITSPTLSLSSYAQQKAPKPVNIFKLADTPLSSLSIHSECLFGLAGLANGTIHLFTLRFDAGLVQHSFIFHRSAVSALCLMDSTALSGSWDQQLVLWDLNTGEKISVCNEHSTIISQIRKLDENTILSLSVDGMLCRWDMRESALAQNIAIVDGNSWALNMDLSKDGNTVYISRKKECVDIFDWRTMSKSVCVKMPSDSGPVSVVRSLSSSSGYSFITASMDNIRQYHSPSKFNIITNGLGNGPMCELLLSEDEQWMVSVGGSRLITESSLVASNNMITFFHLNSY